MIYYCVIIYNIFLYFSILASCGRRVPVLPVQQLLAKVYCVSDEVRGPVSLWWLEIHNRYTVLRGSNWYVLIEVARDSQQVYSVTGSNLYDLIEVARDSQQVYSVTGV